MLVCSHLVFHETVGSDHVLEYALADMCVDGTQRIVEHVDVGVGVERPGQADALLLSARQVDALVADFGAIAVRHDVEVDAHGARVHHSVVLGLVERLAEQYVGAHGGVLDPRLLWHVGHTAVYAHRALLVHTMHFAEQCRQKTRLSRAHLTHDCEYNKKKLSISICIDILVYFFVHKSLTRDQLTLFDLQVEAFVVVKISVFSVIIEI